MEERSLAPAAGEHPGRVIVIAGCMFAGKTARLIERLAAAAGERVVACKHVLDSRYDPAHLATHDGRRFPAVAVPDPAAVERQAAEATVVGIDEAQFFGRALVAVCTRLRAAGGTVIVAGIHHDAWGQDFPPLPQLMALADEVELLHVPCTVCGRPAEYSQRLTPVPAGDMVGGPGDYEPRCGCCFEPLPGPRPVYP